jgi:hypothetical protein
LDKVNIAEDPELMLPVSKLLPLSAVAVRGCVVIHHDDSRALLHGKRSRCELEVANRDGRGARASARLRRRRRGALRAA